MKKRVGLHRKFYIKKKKKQFTHFEFFLIPRTKLKKKTQKMKKVNQNICMASY